MSAQSPSPVPQPAPARSMTGFARVRRSYEGFDVVASVKSVNHRSLDLHFQMSPELDPLEPELRGAVRRRLARGHVEVRAGIARAGTESAAVLNRPLFRAWLAAYREAAAESGCDTPPDLNAALRVPGMLGEDTGAELPPAVRTGVLETLQEALDGLDEFRRREGAEIIAAMLSHVEQIRRAAGELAEIRSRALPLLQTRLHDRLKELLKSASIEPQRLAQEAAILTDRSDIAEEIARLDIHSGQLRDTLLGGGEVGKKLDFLLQEMNREANTILSKTTGIGEAGLRVTDIALGAKAAIEKIREQSLNLE